MKAIQHFFLMIVSVFGTMERSALMTILATMLTYFGVPAAYETKVLIGVGTVGAILIAIHAYLQAHGELVTPSAKLGEALTLLDEVGTAAASTAGAQTASQAIAASSNTAVAKAAGLISLATSQSTLPPPA